MIVSEGLFGQMRSEMLDVAKAIKNRDCCTFEELEERVNRAVALSTRMLERHLNGPEEQDGCYGTLVDWAVYGAENEQAGDLLVAIALRSHADSLLGKLGRDPADEEFLNLVKETRELAEGAANEHVSN